MKRKIPITLKKTPEIDNKTLKLFIMGFLIAAIINMWLFSLRHEEPRRGIVALEMLFRHNFLQPTVLMVPYFRKPPLHNWIILLFSGFNPKFINEFTMRLPSLITTVLTASGIYMFSKKFLREKVAVLSSIIFLTIGLVSIEYSTKCEPDMIFTFFVFLSISLWYTFFEKGEKLKGWILGYLFSSLAFLTKGLPGLAFFLISVFTILFYRKQWKEFFQPAHFLGAIIGISPFVMWVVSISPEKALLTLWKEAARRTALTNSLLKTLKGMALFFPMLFYALIPWSAAMAFEFYKKRVNCNFKYLKNNKFLKEIALLIVANLILYFLSPRTRMRYLIPIFPFISIIFSSILYEKTVNFKRGVAFMQFLMDVLLFIGIIGTIWLTLRTDIALNATIFFLIVAYFVYFYFMKRIDVTNFVLILGCAMLIVRGFYSSYYLSVAEFKRPNYRKVSMEIAKLTQGKSLYTITPDTKIGFYVEKSRQLPLPFKNYRAIPVNALFISENSPKGKVIKEFKLGKKTFYLCKKQ
ncbi:ArnT family glycosyltransferase [Desulfurobacterium atlanticum]|uniref:Dolichyl-phosphate-mannose-protein mannosyltransferase n=1 Tax=Desulfurobacterium atlanticum TaxID=240169 RepID=A0A238YH43_9BACT|nr:glycosyltransferase family 39 protein [Desulfurobacterium atlanticum]SNR69944.1 Dolichyl-phosphate-mannose-protein mannosyltransferase [Desulfurobacterium atlanticum]